MSEDNWMLSWILCTLLCLEEPEPLFVDKCLAAQLRWGDWCSHRVVDERVWGSGPEALLLEVPFGPSCPSVEHLIDFGFVDPPFLLVAGEEVSDFVLELSH